jgi:hypothetical protein
MGERRGRRTGAGPIRSRPPRPTCDSDNYDAGMDQIRQALQQVGWSRRAEWHAARRAPTVELRRRPG